MSAPIAARDAYIKFLLAHGVGGNARAFFKEAERLTAAIEAADADLAPLASSPAGSYDEAVAAIAPYLPDGWVAMDENNRVEFYVDKPKIVLSVSGLWTCSSSTGHHQIRLNFPAVYWRTSLRRIEAGRMVTTKGGVG